MHIGYESGEHTLYMSFYRVRRIMKSIMKMLKAYVKHTIFRCVTYVELDGILVAKVPNESDPNMPGLDLLIIETTRS